MQPETVAVGALPPISSKTMEPVDWLIALLVPLGKLTVVAGQMGQSKSQLTARWAADVSTGHGVVERGSVLMFTAEDDDTDTTRPRLEAAGADTDKVFTVPDDSLAADRIDTYCDQIGDVKLITVDPLTAFFPANVNPWKTPDVRRFLRPIIDLAQRRHLAVVGLLHTNRWSDSADPLSRISEAQGIPQVARSVLVLGADPLEPDGDRRILAAAKSNLTRGRPAVSYRIEEVRVTERISAPRLVHEGDSSTTATELLSGARNSPTDEFLSNALADGPRLAKDVEDEAREQGISKAMVRTARKRLGVKSDRRGGAGASGYWEWSIPVTVQVPRIS